MTLPLWILVVIIAGCGLLIALLIGWLVHVGELAGKEKYDVQERLLREKIYLMETQLAWKKKHVEGILAILRENSNKWEAAYNALHKRYDDARKEVERLTAEAQKTRQTTPQERTEDDKWTTRSAGLEPHKYYLNGTWSPL